MKVRIGIRPTIDGRRGGVRESLEAQTMGMATAAAKLIRENLKYSDGTPVEVIIADTTIAGSAEAAKCAEKFAVNNVTATLTVTPCWCYGLETMDLNPNTIKAVWGFNGTERPGAVYLAAVMAAYAQRGLPAFSIYGKDVQDMDDSTIPEDVAEKILRFAKAAIAAGSMEGKSYVNLGAISMGIAGSNVDASFMQKYLGIRTEWADMTEILRRITLGIYDHKEFDKAKAWVKKNCPIGIDYNEKPRTEHYEEDWDFTIKFALVCNDILFGNPEVAKMGFIEESLGKNAIAGGFQGQRNWTDFLPNGDFTESIFNSSFDWNGAREPKVFATENDTLNGVAMLMGKLVTNSSSVFADVRTYWSPDAVERVSGWRPDGKAANGFIHLINSGAAALDGTGASVNAKGENVIKPWYEVNDKDIDAMLKATDWAPANTLYFRGGGFSSHFRTLAQMPVTMLRVNIVDGLGPVMQIAEGYTIILPENVHKILDERTDKTWPTTWFAPTITGKGAFKDVYSVMANWGANHGSFNYGHIGADIITLCSMLRIPVSMHNVDDNRIFRPHTWSAFGTQDLEGADYRACKNYGPRFK